MSKVFLILGSLNAFLAVGFGAFGAHALKNKIDEHLLTVFQTASQYHFYHSLGLIALGVLGLNIPISNWYKLSGWTMFSGIIFFCGSLYLLAILNLRWLGMITPFGGLLFLLSWIFLTITVIKL